MNNLQTLTLTVSIEGLSSPSAPLENITVFMVGDILYNVGSIYVQNSKKSATSLQEFGSRATHSSSLSMLDAGAPELVIGHSCKFYCSIL